MIGPREIPTRESLVEYNYAVAGHAGTLCDPKGELFIKPCTQDEIDFYQSAVDEHPEMADIMPLFMGSLILNDAASAADISAQLPAAALHMGIDVKEAVVELAQGPVEAAPAAAATAAVAAAAAAAAAEAAAATPASDNITWQPTGAGKIKTDRAVVLENAAYGYRRPNIVDVKLGQRLWADNAPLQKRVKFDQIRAETTHEKYGFRIAGMRVYKGSPCAADLDEEDYKIYDKDWGRTEVNDDNVVDAFRKYIFNAAAGVDDEMGRAVAQAFKADLEHVRDVLEREASRMYSCSLLFIFEGDGEALRAAVDDTGAAESEKGKAGASGRSNFRVDSGIDLDEDGELIPGTGGDDEDDEDDEINLPRIYSLKLIDFAHAKWVPDQGPDENVLVGVRSLIKIFDELSKSGS